MARSAVAPRPSIKPQDPEIDSPIACFSMYWSGHHLGAMRLQQHRITARADDRRAALSESRVLALADAYEVQTRCTIVARETRYPLTSPHTKHRSCCQS